MNDTGSPKQGQVPENMVILIESCEGLHKEIESLEKRLDPVLRSLEPRPTGKSPEQKIDNLVNLAALIRERATSIRLAISRIQDLAQRLEL